MGAAKRRVHETLDQIKADVERHHEHGHGVHDHHGHDHHRRSETARLAILNAADDLLVERGFAGVTVEGIAARAGVGKQTIYRWWTSKTEVLMETFLSDAAEELAPPDTGRIEDDLRIQLRQLVAFLTGSDAGAVLKALLGQAQHDSAMAAVFRERYLSQQRTSDLAVLTRAVARGELPADLDLESALDQLVGPIYYRVLVTGAPVGATFTDGLVDRLLGTANPPGAAHSPCGASVREESVSRAPIAEHGDGGEDGQEEH
jgi:AcrR family transcriptional regulator